MSHHRLTTRQFLILGLVSVSAPLGDTLLARGMTAMPAISLSNPVTLLASIFTPWVIAGIALLICFFSSYLNALSWADLTFVRPATALGNVLVELFSRFWLHETVSVERWAGVVLVTIGASFVAQGPSSTHHPIEEPPQIEDLPPIEEEEAEPVLQEEVR